MSYLVPLDRTTTEKKSDKERPLLGGKGARLAWLVRHGLPVPKTHVLTTLAFKSQLRRLLPAHEIRSLLRGDDRERLTRGEAARTAFLAAPLDPAVVKALRTYYDEHRGDAPFGFAVRSSATVEDLPGLTLAGLAETRLPVFGFEALCEAVKGVWASLYAGRSLAYLGQRGVKDASMAVVLQPVVAARAAGVLFTRPPLPSAQKRGFDRVINATFGLGLPVVDGHGSPDVFVTGRDGVVKERRIARKETALEVLKDANKIGGGTLREAPVTDPFAPSLDEADLAALAAAATKIESLEHEAFDVEFAFDQTGALRILQARPIAFKLPTGGTARTVWSRANVGEALPGPATPLTWSVAAAFSENGFRRAFAALGCTVGKNVVLVGDVYGRFYLNLSEFLAIAAQVPWLDPRKLVELGGGFGAADLAPVADASSTAFWLKAPFLAKRLASEQLRLVADVDRFEEEARAYVERFRALDLGILPDEALAKRWVDVQRWLDRTGQVMLACASSALGTHLLLERLLDDGKTKENGLAERLVAGIRDLESARPALALARVAELAAREPEALAALQKGTVTGLDDFPPGPARTAFAALLDQHGDRGAHEAELARPRWREAPGPLLAILRMQLPSGTEAPSAGAPPLAERLVRTAAQADEEFRKTSERLSFPRRKALRHLLERTRTAARLRERTRAWVTRILGLLREIALEADTRLVALMPRLATTAETPAVFFLTGPEIVATLLHARNDVAPLVAARRAAHARDRARPEPPATFVGMPTTALLPTDVADGDGRLLTGLAASSGVVEGVARVLEGPEQIGNFCAGEILVTRATDVGWTPLFPAALAVVTELGGPLSHAAIVARELSVPCVVDVDGALRTIRNGDRLRVDGDWGTVRILA